MSSPEKPQENSFICEMCGGGYFPGRGEPERGIAPGTEFGDLPEGWVCPQCDGHKWDFGHGATGVSHGETPRASTQIPWERPPRDPSPVWNRFVTARAEGKVLPIPDWSHAGYRGGEEPIPERTGEVFDVTKFGAPADGTGDARTAVEQAIAAAERAGGGIVYFPPGRFRFNSRSGETEPMRIRGANITLAGAGAEHSVLYMEHHMVPPDPFYKWLIAPLFRFAPKAGGSGKIVARLEGEAATGTLELDLDRAVDKAPGDVVALYGRSPAMTNEFLCGREPWPIWKTTVSKGPVQVERHRIESVRGRKLVLAAPIHGRFHGDAGVEVLTQAVVPGWRVEDLTFEGAWHETIVHHKNFIHDSGWTMLEMVRGLDPVVRRCRFKDMNVAATMVSCVNGTFAHCTALGNPGHCLWGAMAGSTNTLLTQCVDETDGGQWHGPAASKGATGTVIHRYRGQYRSGPDFHGSWPRATLMDASISGLVGVGGHFRLLPNHGPHCLWWNHRQVGGPEANLDFWMDRVGEESYSGAKISGAWIIGFTSDKPVTFREASLARLESPGTPVAPASLYEAQWDQRHGFPVGSGRSPLLRG